MTWREFMLLLGGLSQRSRTSMALGNRTRSAGPVRRIYNATAARSHFATIG